MTKPVRLASIAIAAVLLLIFFLVTGARAQSAAPAIPRSREEVTLSFAPVVRTVQPAVVNIFTRRVVRQQASPLLADPMFRRFFGDRLPPGMNQERVQNSLGSGVIVRPDGLIVTNVHVIKDSDEIRVVLSDHREFDATVVRADERTDIAVLKIEVGREQLPALALRDSDELEVGDLVLAIGNPFGVGQTVTMGIVSALQRTSAGIGDYRFFIQTDAAINPGNSGGALVTMDGKLAGINTAIYSQSGGSIGIGFAIPANMVRTVIEAAPGGKGAVVRAWLGASGPAVTGEIAQSLGLKRPVGVLVKEVYPGGPADGGGLRSGDVITQVEGREIDDYEALRFRIATQPIGATVRLAVWRKGAEVAVPVVLAPPPETPPRDTQLLRGNQPLAGAVVGNLSPAFAEELGLPTQLRGVVVVEVRRNSPARSVGIRPSDVILRVNDREVGAAGQLQALLDGVGSGWRIQFRREGEIQTIQVRR